jgi:aminoglycoside phosphotransferase (APT) family kinase protein
VPNEPAVDPVVSEVDHLQRSSRDTSTVPALLSEWLSTVLPGGTKPEITVESGIDSNGMSSETIILTGRWTENGAPQEQKWVARVAPTEQDVPVFASYRLDHQFEVMRLAGELTDVPVPPVRWLENTGDVLGAPFFLMDHVDGIVPPDVMPYTFGNNWFADATPEQQRELQDATVEVIAKLHSIPNADKTFDFLADADPPGDTALRRHFGWLKDWYEFCVPGIGRSALVERALTWLEDNFPPTWPLPNPFWCGAIRGSATSSTKTSGRSPCWTGRWPPSARASSTSRGSSSRTTSSRNSAAGRDARPAGRAARGRRPRNLREAHRVEVGDLRWFYIYSGVVWCCVFMRTGFRRVHFGEMEARRRGDAVLPQVTVGKAAGRNECSAPWTNSRSTIPSRSPGRARATGTSTIAPTSTPTTAAATSSSSPASATTPISG